MDKVYEYQGLVLVQSDYNWHYMIFDKKTKKMLLHASCTEPLTEEGAKQAIEQLLDYIERREGNDDLSTEDGD